MSETSDLKSISKFNGQNFQLWKFQIRAALVAHDLLGIVEGRDLKPTQANPATDENTTQIQAWTKKNAKDMFYLSSTMEYSQLEYLVTCLSAHEMWKKLSEIHEQKSASNKLAMTTKFHEHRMSPGDSIAQHFAKLENMANQLKDIGEAVSDIMIMAKIISTLPTKFNAFVSAWDSVPTESQNLTNLRERLLREQARMTSADDADKAFAAMSISKKGNGNHHRDDKKEREKSLTCNFCKRQGHIARYCYARKRAQKKDKSLDGNSNARPNGDEPANFTAFIVSKNSNGIDLVNANIVDTQTHEFFRELNEKDCWLLDSGASRHMSWHMSWHQEWFAELTPCNNEYVYLGDGRKLEIKGDGKIPIMRLVDNELFEGIIENVL